MQLVTCNLFAYILSAQPVCILQQRCENRNCCAAGAVAPAAGQCCSTLRMYAGTCVLAQASLRRCRDRRRLCNVGRAEMGRARGRLRINSAGPGAAYYC